MKKCFKFTMLAIAALPIFGIAAANAGEQYQTEVSAFYSRRDDTSDFRMTSTGVSGEVFFAPVNTEEHPYAEAAFLERTGSIFITADEQEARTGWVKDGGSELGAGINLSQPGFPLTLQLTYTTSRIIMDAPRGFTLTSNAYDFKFGNYFTKTLFAGVEYNYVRRDDIIPLFSTLTSRINDYGLFAKYIHELGDYKELSFEATISRSTIGSTILSNRNTDESISVDYFFNKSLSAGLGFENNSGTDESSEGQTYSANVRYFVNPRLSIQAKYDRFRNSHPDEDSDHTYEFILAGRF